MAMDRSMSFHKDDDFFSDLNDLKSDELTGLLFPSSPYHEAVDIYCFFTNSRISIDSKSPTLLNKSSKDLLVCLQVKKDFDVSCKEYKDIQDGWNKKKEKISQFFSNDLFLI